MSFEPEEGWIPGFNCPYPNSDESITSLGECVRLYRAVRNMSARQMAEATGGVLTRAVISNLETGRKTEVTVTELVALARALKVPAGALDERLRETP